MNEKSDPNMETSLARLRSACEEVYQLHQIELAKRHAIASAATQAVTQLRNLAEALKKKDEPVAAGFAVRTAENLNNALN